MGRILTYSYLASFIYCFLLLGSCSDSDEAIEDSLDDEPSTWDIIQSEILEKNCLSCHVEGTSFARQSDLILTADQAYKQLVDRVPANLAARSDGLLLVGTKGLQSLYTSFLWEKINYPDFEHFFSDHPEYGELMPFGGPALTNGELRFISDWIIAGAPDTGIVADIDHLLDTTRFVIPEGEFSVLEPPLQGVQMNLGPFDVWPQSERELFYYEPLGNQEALYINRVEISMREGSHHFILYDYPSGNRPTERVYRDFWSEDGVFNLSTAASLINQRFVFGTQWRITNYQFPPGVALKIPANAGFDLNSHYVNRTNQMKTGEVSVNVHTIPSSEVQFVAKNIFENYTDFSLPPKQITTITRQSIFDEKMFVFQLTSHAHEHMTEFKIFLVGGPEDGELIYYTNDWEHPPLLEFDPPLVLEPGQGFRAEATYDNQTDRTLRFGLLSEDEMMIVFGAFYTER